MLNFNRDSIQYSGSPDKSIPDVHSVGNFNASQIGRYTEGEFDLEMENLHQYYRGLKIAQQVQRNKQEEWHLRSEMVNTAIARMGYEQTQENFKQSAYTLVSARCKTAMAFDGMHGHLAEWQLKQEATRQKIRKLYHGVVTSTIDNNDDRDLIQAKYGTSEIGNQFTAPLRGVLGTANGVGTAIKDGATATYNTAAQGTTWIKNQFKREPERN